MELIFKKTIKGNKVKNGNKIIMSAFFVLFLIYSFTLVYPFIWLFINSFKSTGEFLSNPMGLPKKVKFINYVDIFIVLREDGYNLLSMFFNSISLVIGQVCTSLFVSACAAYVVSRYKFFGKNGVYFLALLIMFVPTTGSLVVFYKMVQDMHMIDNYLGMIVMHAGGFGFAFIVLYGFFKSISWTYAEAAFMDGAGNFKVFFLIMLPMAKSAIIALAVLNSISVWNDYMGQLLYYRARPTVAVGLQNLSASIVEYGSKYPLFFCAILVCTVPIVVLYSLTQSIIVKNTVAGGLKG